MSKISDLGRRLGRLLVRKELVSVFIMVFLADVVTGIFSPTFSLYATSIGASLALVGALNSVVGLTRIVTSVPIGIVSDTKGRKGILVLGMLGLAASAFCYTFVDNPYLLFPIRMIHGVALTSTFFMGMAYAGDNVTRSELGLVSGVYTTCMGLGFTIGSELGGRLATEFGYSRAYQVAAVLALIGFAVALWGLAPKRHMEQMRRLTPTFRFDLLTKDPQLLAACLGHMLNILIFDAALAIYFPLYAKSLSIGLATIGSMFAIRALASTVVRLPAGMLTSRFPSRRLMMFALVVGNVMVVLLCLASTPVPLTLILIGEGTCYGIYLVSGQAFINEKYDASTRGTAIGVYSMMGSIAGTAGPFLLGAVAEQWGLSTVFRFTAVLVFLGVVSFVYLTGKGSHTEPGPALSGVGSS